MSNKISKALAMLDFRYLRFRVGVCPMHGASLFVNLNNTMLGIRCCLCGAAPIATSIVKVLQDRVPDFKKKVHFELSSRGPFFEFLNKNVQMLTYSEYLDGVSPGSYKNGVQCQDVQNLTLDNSSFDIVTCTEVFEHVPNDIAGFSEVLRVLRTGGTFIFTVPLFPAESTIERVVLKDNKLEYLLEPTYHDDSIRGAGKVLVFRDYGMDIQNRLEDVGFKDVEIINVPDSGGFGFNREVVVAYK